VMRAWVRDRKAEWWVRRTRARRECEGAQSPGFSCVEAIKKTVQTCNGYMNVDWKVDGLRLLAVVPDCLKKILDKWPRESVERLVTQSGVLRYARSANLIKRTRKLYKKMLGNHRSALFQLHVGISLVRSPGWIPGFQVLITG
jgi:hypothetical protein